ncbi:hypothetical protein MPRM_05720 [Mycobacterium parmense]|uniref:Uncharacterized protein n=1 Tax=Mycobacterium parmense TaxID=185642 RepID=A0A7I7YRB0_9MYCO|nr:hypothetical protein MPRM_05720 [Mycobacterium parmense]
MGNPNTMTEGSIGENTKPRMRARAEMARAEVGGGAGSPAVTPNVHPLRKNREKFAVSARSTMGQHG